MKKQSKRKPSKRKQPMITKKKIGRPRKEITVHRGVPVFMEGSFDIIGYVLNTNTYHVHGEVLVIKPTPLGTAPVKKPKKK